jgi:hypothetical protein
MGVAASRRRYMPSGDGIMSPAFGKISNGRIMCLAILSAATVSVLGSLAADPLAAVIAGAVVALPFLVFHVLVAVRPWLFLFLITKPAVDLAWRWKFFEVGAYPVNLQAIIGVLVIGVVILAAMGRSKGILLYPPIIMLGVLAGISVLMTPTVAGINELLRLYAGLGFGIAGPIILRDRCDIERLGQWILLSVSIPVVLSYFQLIGLLPYEYFDWTEAGELSRVSGTYQHPLGLIFFLIIAIPLALFVIHSRRTTKWRRVMCYVFLGAALGILPFTYHRAGMVVITAQIFFWFVLTGQRRKAVMVVAAAGVAALLLVDWVSVLFGNIGVESGRVTSDSLRGRGVNWLVFIYAYIHGNPLQWIFGFGQSLAAGEVPGFGQWSSDEPHTDYLRMLYAYGITGLVLYLAILGGIVRRAIRLYRSCDEEYRLFGALGLVVVFAIIALTFTCEPIRYPTPAWYFFTIAAFVVSQDGHCQSLLAARKAKQF